MASVASYERPGRGGRLPEGVNATGDCIWPNVDIRNIFAETVASAVGEARLGKISPTRELGVPYAIREPKSFCKCTQCDLHRRVMGGIALGRGAVRGLL